MVIGNLSESQRYEALHPLFGKLFEYLRTHDLLTMPEGRIEVEGDRLFINNVRPMAVPADKQLMEVHRKYIDVHFLLEGNEKVGFRSLGECVDPTTEFNEQDDYQLYRDTPSTYVDYKPGQFVICFPEDAHAPLIGEGQIKKCIAKVLL